MALIEFQDLPSTQTPINSTNLNNNFNELDTKTNPQIITAELTSNFTKTIADYEKLTLASAGSAGTKLTISNGGIKIGSGVSKIKVSAKASFNSVASSGLKWLTIFNNNSAIIPNPNNLTARGMIYSTTTIVSVQENDIIYMYVNGVIGDVVRGGSGYTNMTVEVIE